MYLLSSKNATVSSSDCPTCVIRYHPTYFPHWSMPWSSRTSGTAWLSLEMGRKKTYSASKKSWTLRCALFPADVSLTTYRTCGRSWAGLPPVSCTNSTPSASFTKSAAPETQRPFPPSFRWTLYSALEPQGRTLIWPSRAWGLRRVGGAYFLTRCSLTTAYRRRFVTFFFSIFFFINLVRTFLMEGLTRPEPTVSRACSAGPGPYLPIGIFRVVGRI